MTVLSRKGSYPIVGSAVHMGGVTCEWESRIQQPQEFVMNEAVRRDQLLAID
jgi:hypothetical protein